MELGLLDMVLKLAAAEVAIHTNARAALERVAVKVEETAKSEFGAYQPAVDQFPAWAELAESTKEERVRLGYTENDPLLRSGETRDGIGHRVEELEAEIGSDSDILVYHEFGTANMPPRPVLGPALARNEEAIVNELGGAVVAGLLEGSLIHASLGYGRVITG